MNLIKQIKKIWRNIHPKCPKCDTGRLWHIGTDVIGRWNTQHEVYECDVCKEWFL